MTIHVLVEGPSERAFLERWSPRALRDQAVKVHPHQGKGQLPADPSAKPDPKHRGLLDQLPAKLRAFASTSGAESLRVVVLVDADDEDPESLAEAISTVAESVSPNLEVLVRLAIEETEAFYLGDLAALEKAYPDADMKRARKYQPDSVVGTWELFGAIVNDGGGNKVAWAESMGSLVTTQAARSRSPSFKAFVTGLRSFAPSETPAPRTRRYRHTPKNRQEPGRRR